MKEKSNKYKEFDFNRIKHSLNTSMEDDNIIVSEELISKTMNKIQEESNLDNSDTPNNKWYDKLTPSNVVVALLLILILGTGIGKI